MIVQKNLSLGANKSFPSPSPRLTVSGFFYLQVILLVSDISTGFGALERDGTTEPLWSLLTTKSSYEKVKKVLKPL